MKGKDSLRILISNDDGIHAEGIGVLEETARQISDDLWVVAPESEQSAASHALSTRIPLRIKKYGEKRYSVDGTPTDSIVMAVKHILKDRKPALILSGINHGMNLGEDVIYSGTVAAAMEGAILGIPSIAFSLRIDPKEEVFNWETPRHFGADIIRRIWETLQGNPNKKLSRLYNVNFPAIARNQVSGIELCCQGQRVAGSQVVETTEPRFGRPIHWIGLHAAHDCSIENSDLNAIAYNFITVTPLKYDLTDHDSIEAFKALDW